MTALAGMALIFCCGMLWQIHKLAFEIRAEARAWQEFERARADADRAEMRMRLMHLTTLTDKD